MQQKPFWETTSLDDMSDEQWESLCDGCGRCCMNKLEDEGTGEIAFTRIACKLLDTQTCHCNDYANRFQQVPDCLSVRPLDAKKLSWLPESCAYRRLSEGKKLENWHPLCSGTSDSVHSAGISMAQKCISEEYIALEDFEVHIIQWSDIQKT